MAVPLHLTEVWASYLPHAVPVNPEPALGEGQVKDGVAVFSDIHLRDFTIRVGVR